MIAVDASAVLAILFDEPEAPEFRALLVREGGVMSPVNYWEVLARAFVALGEPGVQAAEALVEALAVEVTTASAQDSRIAVDAFRRFGKRSSGHLNLGDCFAYALAQVEGGGLLFKGEDFRKTDVAAALE